MPEHQMFGYFNEKYYAIDERDPMLLIENADYKSDMINAVINESQQVCDVNIYRYHSDLVVDCNEQRVAAMKEFIIHEKVKEILKVTDQLLVAVKYSLYNKDGKMIKAGTMEGLSCAYTPTIMNPINANNVLDYRKAMLAHTMLEIPIPEIARYGIKNQYDQHPYTLKIEKIILGTTTGGYKYIEAHAQNELEGCSSEAYEYNFYNAPHAAHVCSHNPLIHNNFACHFMMNAPCGSTIISSMVTPVSIKTPDEYEYVPMCEFDTSDKQYTIHIDKKLKNIRVNVEVMLDNFNVVYDKEDIQKLVDEIIASEITPVEPSEEEMEENTEKEEDLNSPENEENQGNNEEESSSNEPEENTGTNEPSTELENNSGTEPTHTEPTPSEENTCTEEEIP